MSGGAVRIYHLAYRDGTIELGLSYVHRAYLVFLLDRGGQERFDWSKLTEEQRAHLRKLIEPARCLSEAPSIGDRPEVVIHRLTDIGRNLAVKIREEGGP